MSAADIWIVDLALSPDQLDLCAAVLDAAERDRAARFLRPVDRMRYRASHAALRLILGEALGLAPAEIRLEAGAGGKPELAGSARGTLDFNLSHSGGRALIGLARGAAIGVDVEEIRPITDALRIARAHFAPDEAAALAALSPNAIDHAFFGLWTRKEAVVKALGSGLSLPLNRFSVSVPPEPPRLLRMAEGGAWTLAGIDCGAGYAATIAVRSAEAGIAVRHLRGDWPSRLQ
ncbi:4'-phosphopantetheinyl transferase family protein [Methylobacterium sp. E-066]|uniref:4'-phosphopantetheinyl transferase family protein n=1 Tax=Methylobacterium sp. E-066 TaxID=2836584 RepID=UPI001FB8AEC9|nr:4'-phosphopantetheinyl transferase superfamily protein [Methylobacterium sp. E-066]MCJ2141374.1 4'-phosphopantetheinyl transferase superfamily protein [Methylobacterium sp. E-066]